MSQDPYKPPVAPLDIAIPVPRERDLVKTYVCFAISSLIVGIVAGAVMGAIIGAAWSKSGAPALALPATVMVCSGLTGLIVNYFVFRFFVVRFIVVKFVRELKGAA